jgi:hypothetical protein
VARLGGHGVVGVRLSQGALPTVLGGLEITVIGTAVRAPGAASAPPPPFTCTLSGQDFAKLITTGWVPVGIAQGISIGARHDDWTTARQARWTIGNVEVTGWTDLVGQCRRGGIAVAWSPRAWLWCVCASIAYGLRWLLDYGNPT